jgi:hypothetical protein
MLKSEAMYQAPDIAPALRPTVFRLDPDTFARYRNQLAIRLGVVMPIVAAALIYLRWHFDRSVSAFVFVPALVIWLAYHKFREERNKWEILEFEFRDGKLSRRLEKYPTVELLPSDVTAIVETPRGIEAATSSRNKNLFLSNKLCRYQTLRNQLCSWVPSITIKSQPNSHGPKVRTFIEVLACLSVFGGPLYLIYTSNVAVVLPWGCFFRPEWRA